MAPEGGEDGARVFLHHLLPVTGRSRVGHLAEDPVNHQLDQFFLVGHVTVERRGRDPDLVGHPAHGQRVPAISLDHLQRGADHHLPAELRPRGAAAARRRLPRRLGNPGLGHARHCS
jgi:hypothetical protein